MGSDREKSNPIFHLKIDTILALNKKGDDLVEIISLGLSGFTFNGTLHWKTQYFYIIKYIS